MIGLRKIRRSKRFRSIYPLTTINSLPFFRMKTKLQRSRNKNSIMEAVDRPICILRSHFVTEVHRMQILPHMRHILPADWPCKTISIIKKETRFSTRFAINHLYIDYRLFEKAEKRTSSFISTSIAKSPRFSR